MPAVIDKITPGLGRTGDTINLIGSGFSPSAGQNTVTVDGQAAAVTLDSEPQVDITVPGGIGVDQLVVVVITNLDDSSTFTFWWWSKPSTAFLSTQVLPVQLPFLAEIEKGLSQELDDIKTLEAKDFERLAETQELLRVDLVNALGAMASMSTTGLRRVAPGALGQFLTSHLSGAIFQGRQVHTLKWGRELAAATTVATLMEAGGIDTLQTVLATAEVAPQAGRIAVVSLFARATTFSRVDTIELLVNGSVVDTKTEANDGVFLSQGQHFTYSPDVTVSQGDRIEVRITKSNPVSTWSGRAMAVIL